MANITARQMEGKRFFGVVDTFFHPGLTLQKPDFTISATAARQVRRV
jgi:hypothetical protein